jgi:O-antigen ligase
MSRTLTVTGLHDATAPNERPHLVLNMRPLARAGMALAIGTSGLVFTEPAPCDLVMMGLIVLLPLAGLVTWTRSLILCLLLWLAAGSGALIASAMSEDLPRSATHTGVSFFLYIGAAVTAAFIAHRPQEHMTLILRAYVLAALIAALAGIAGYFNAFPGAFDLFTKFGRATGTFKDPNVFGPFLIPAVLYCANRLLNEPGQRKLPAIVIGAVLSFAILLSFSRGAWISFGVAIAIFGYFSYVTAPTSRDRQRMALIGLAGAGAVVLLMMAALQIEAVSSLLAERSSLTQGYDVGPEGRFGGQEKARGLILDNPFGIGATEFSSRYHHEDVHNVYLSSFLNGGWLGGLMYLFAVGLTAVIGFRGIRYASPLRPLVILAFAAFAGNVVEGLVIDTDHWRHFYLLMAMIWGLAAAEAQMRAALGRNTRV